MKRKKTVFLNAVATECGASDRTVAVIRANKDGTRAEVQFVGDEPVACFQTVAKAWSWLCGYFEGGVYFQPTDDYPAAYRDNFV